MKFESGLTAAALAVLLQQLSLGADAVVGSWSAHTLVLTAVLRCATQVHVCRHTVNKHTHQLQLHGRLDRLSYCWGPGTINVVKPLLSTWDKLRNWLLLDRNGLDLAFRDFFNLLSSTEVIDTLGSKSAYIYYSSLLCLSLRTRNIFDNNINLKYILNQG